MRTEFPAKIKLQAWERCQIDGKPHCECCDMIIVGRPEYDHDKPDGLGGLPTLDNCRVLCVACHKIKTHTVDRPIMAKADRQKKSHAGVKKSTRPLPGGRGSKLKKLMNGRVIER